MAGREVVENGLPSRDEITVYGLGATWTDQQWLAQVFMYGVYSLGGFALLSLATCRLRRRGLLDRRCRVALARGGRTRDLGHVPAGAHRGAVGMVDPRADARAPALHRPPLAARVGGADADDDVSGSRSRCSSSGRTSTAASLLGALLVMLLGAYELIRSRGGTWLRSVALVVLAPLAVLATPYGPVATARYYHLLLVDPPFAGRVTEWRWAAPRGLNIDRSSTLLAGDHDRCS